MVSATAQEVAAPEQWAVRSGPPSPRVSAAPLSASP